MEIKQFQRAAGISEALAARWFSHITSAMKEFVSANPKIRQCLLLRSGMSLVASTGCRKISTTASPDWLTSFGLGVSPGTG